MSSNNEPSKASGQAHSVKGNLVETVGNLTGSESWTESGREEHAKGEAETNSRAFLSCTRVYPSSSWPSCHLPAFTIPRLPAFSSYRAAEAKNWMQGTADVLCGCKDSVVGAITGDKSQQASGNIQKESGKAQQDANKPL
ncbi:hypothetical protein D9758_008339 [Tetrapyrgos nigripes]|uniref:CsbD-like domain-containing protein n=1 Tax=Tetrapyrgos nigripes TaxID=182062 RepID=A0A8H5GEB3_9AGAR|nr:hypothetical protein D9758_008339 [Tetrapyrgos nigripes]